MGGNAEGPNILNLFIGFLILAFILTELHGFSFATALFAVPFVIVNGLILFISFLGSALVGLTLGGLAAGPVGLLVLLAAMWLVWQNVTVFKPDNFMLFAILLIFVLLLI